MTLLLICASSGFECKWSGSRPLSTANIWKLHDFRINQTEMLGSYLVSSSLLHAYTHLCIVHLFKWGKNLNFALEWELNGATNIHRFCFFFIYFRTRLIFDWLFLPAANTGRTKNAHYHRCHHQAIYCNRIRSHMARRCSNIPHKNLHCNLKCPNNDALLCTACLPCYNERETKR